MIPKSHKVRIDPTNTRTIGLAHYDRGLRCEERGGGRAGELLRLRQGQTSSF